MCVCVFNAKYALVRHGNLQSKSWFAMSVCFFERHPKKECLKQFAVRYVCHCELHGRLFGTKSIPYFWMPNIFYKLTQTYISFFILICIFFGKFVTPKYEQMTCFRNEQTTNILYRWNRNKAKKSMQMCCQHCSRHKMIAENYECDLKFLCRNVTVINSIDLRSS